MFLLFFLAQVEVHAVPGSTAGGMDGENKVKGNCLACHKKSGFCITCCLYALF